MRSIWGSLVARVPTTQPGTLPVLDVQQRDLSASAHVPLGAVTRNDFFPDPPPPKPQEPLTRAPGATCRCSTDEVGAPESMPLGAKPGKAKPSPSKPGRGPAAATHELLRKENRILRAALQQGWRQGAVQLIPPPQEPRACERPDAEAPEAVRQLAARLREQPSHGDKVAFLRLQQARFLGANTNADYLDLGEQPTTTAQDSFTWGEGHDRVATTHCYRRPGEDGPATFNRRRDELSVYLEEQVKFKNMASAKKGGG